MNMFVTNSLRCCILKCKVFDNKSLSLKLNRFGFSSIRQENSKAADYYKLLNLKRDCSFQQIKQGYLAASKKYHPDAIRASQSQYQQKSTQDIQDMFIVIQQAFNVLNNPKTRKKHDLELGISESQWERQYYFTSSNNLQNQQFDKILNTKLNIENIQAGRNPHQILLQKYSKQLQFLTFKQKIKGLWFYFGLFATFWCVWYAVQNVVIRHKGQHNIHVSDVKSDKKLSIVPINFK